MEDRPLATTSCRARRRIVQAGVPTERSEHDGLILEFSLDFQSRSFARMLASLLSTAEAGSRRGLCRSCDNRTHKSRVTS
jgi:hypothetical protein